MKKKKEVKKTMKKYKCMYCGKYHADKGGSCLLSKHVYLYYKQGGTIPLSGWKTK